GKFREQRGGAPAPAVFLILSRGWRGTCGSLLPGEGFSFLLDEGTGCQGWSFKETDKTGSRSRCVIAASRAGPEEWVSGRPAAFGALAGRNQSLGTWRCLPEVHLFPNAPRLLLGALLPPGRALGVPGFLPCVEL
ncbi:hypothetical protein H1C71_018543, partial [Ictidomys tridecemlineatus]